MMTRLDDLRNVLALNKQEHLLRFYEDLSDAQKETYVSALEQMDFKELNDLYVRAIESNSSEAQKLDDQMKAIPEDCFESAERSSPENIQKYYEIGLKEVSNGTVAVLLMAGGQGTRLGVNYPKGMYCVGLISGKSLFQMLAERILRVQQLANDKYKTSASVITWYIMTSGPTIKQTKEYLHANKYFGLSEENVVIFEQGLLPCYDLNGKILMDDKDKLALAPDGNGGVFKALQVNGILDDFRSRGVKHIHTHSVDNILTKVADPVFIGYCVENDADCCAKVVKKATPDEAVGVVCLVNDKFQVVEYSEITDITANLRNANGELVFMAGNICNHYFRNDLLEKVCEKQFKLHVASKKIPHVNENGESIKPSTPNGIKIEKFVFDVFEFSERFLTWEVARDSEFSALKNADSAGKDCPTTAKRDLYTLHKKYLENVQATVIGDEIEISPLLSYAGEGLEKFAGITIETPKYLELL